MLNAIDVRILSTVYYVEDSTVFEGLVTEIIKDTKRGHIIGVTKDFNIRRFYATDGLFISLYSTRKEALAEVLLSMEKKIEELTNLKKQVLHEYTK